MGFLDKAKAAASDLAAKADEALSSSGLAGPSGTNRDAERLFRDLGVMAYQDATGRPVDEAERSRVMDGLRSIEAQGTLGNLALVTTPTAAPAPPPPPGAVAQGMASPPPPPPSPQGAPAPTPPPPPAPGGATPPPPPPPAPGGATPPPPPPPPPPAPGA